MESDAVAHAARTVPVAPRAVGVAETHSAVVFFVGDHAYKLKKPVRFPFLDFSTREARQAVCHREVELNRRLAPDVYLGVADVVGPDGEPMDHLVVMRRMPEERRLSSLVRAGVMVEDDLRRLARVIAMFHARAETSAEIAEAASRDSLAIRWESNAEEMQRFVGPVLEHGSADRVRTLARRYLAGREPLFAARARAGRPRDGHGDLLADDVFCLADGPRVLDCLEFDDRLRWEDVVADIAFLAMDLERLGRPDLARCFLDEYRNYSGDTWPASFAHHHIAYRAQVRAKIACLRWEQGDHAAETEARQLFAIAHDHLERARVRLIVVGGLPGTGKSTVASAIGDALGAVVLRSDEIRKQSVALDVTTPARAAYGEGIYTTASTGQTYATMLERARDCLVLGESVVLDASWADEAHRHAARALAEDTVADLDELHCVLPREIAHARLAARAGDASDADGRIADAMATAEAPWPGATVIDTGPPVAVVRRTVLAAVGSPPDSEPEGVQPVPPRRA